MFSPAGGVGWPAGSPLADEGFGEAVRVAFGEDEVGVVEQPTVAEFVSTRYRNKAGQQWVSVVDRCPQRRPVRSLPLASRRIARRGEQIDAAAEFAEHAVDVP